MKAGNCGRRSSSGGRKSGNRGIWQGREMEGGRCGWRRSSGVPGGKGRRNPPSRRPFRPGRSAEPPGLKNQQQCGAARPEKSAAVQSRQVRQNQPKHGADRSGKTSHRRRSSGVPGGKGRRIPSLRRPFRPGRSAKPPGPAQLAEARSHQTLRKNRAASPGRSDQLAIRLKTVSADKYYDTYYNRENKT